MSCESVADSSTPEVIYCLMTVFDYTLISVEEVILVYLKVFPWHWSWRTGKSRNNSIRVAGVLAENLNAP